jgi:predicted membrane protein
VFGKSTLDLSKVLLENDKHIKISCAFGEYIIFLSPSINYEIQSSSAFGHFNMPGNQNNSFGNVTYHNKDYDSIQPKLILKTEVAFGSIVVKFKE